MHTADPPKTAFVSVALRSVVMMLVRVFGALSTLVTRSFWPGSLMRKP